VPEVAVPAPPVPDPPVPDPPVQESPSPQTSPQTPGSETAPVSNHVASAPTGSPHGHTPNDPLDRIPVLGVPISAVTMQTALQTIGTWIAQGDSRYVSTSDVHCIMRARSEPDLMAALQSADMVLPDGKPVEWSARVRAKATMSRVCGPDLMLRLSDLSARNGWRQYYYGGAPGVADLLSKRLQDRFPGLQVAGTRCPPFRPLTPQEQADDIARMTDAGAQVVWVGLGCPKQDMWMRKHARSIPGAVSIGVGAAFDFHTGRIQRAPVFMQRSGLEWAHRLASEPTRLWRRYLVLAPRFAVLSGAETLQSLARQRSFNRASSRSRPGA